MQPTASGNHKNQCQCRTDQARKEIKHVCKDHQKTFSIELVPNTDRGQNKHKVEIEQRHTFHRMMDAVLRMLELFRKPQTFPQAVVMTKAEGEKYKPGTETRSRRTSIVRAPANGVEMKDRSMMI